MHHFVLISHFFSNSFFLTILTVFSLQFVQHILHVCACVNSLIISMCQAVLASPAGRATLGVLAFYVITLLLTSLSCHLQLNYSHHLAVSHLPILFLSLSFHVSFSNPPRLFKIFTTDLTHFHCFFTLHYNYFMQLFSFIRIYERWVKNTLLCYIDDNIDWQSLLFLWVPFVWFALNAKGFFLTSSTTERNPSW